MSVDVSRKITEYFETYVDSLALALRNIVHLLADEMKDIVDDGVKHFLQVESQMNHKSGSGFNKWGAALTSTA